MAEVKVGFVFDDKSGTVKVRQLGDELEKTGKKASTLGDRLKGDLTKNLESLASRLGPVGGLLSGLGPAGLAGAAGLAAVSGAGALLIRNLAELGAKVSGVSNAFGRLAKDSDGLLAAARASTRGMITDFELMQAANKGILLGLPITADEMRVLGETAISLGRAMNVGPTQALSDLVTGLGRGSAAILDNLGITVKAQDAYAVYAETIGKTASDLSESEKKLAIYQSAMTAAKEKVAEMGEIQLTLGDRIQQTSAEWGNQYDALAQAVSESTILNGVYQGLSDSASELATDVGEAVSTIVELAEVAAQLKGFDAGVITIDNVAGAVKRLVEVVKNGFAPLNAFLMGVRADMEALKAISAYMHGDEAAPNVIGGNQFAELANVQTGTGTGRDEALSLLGKGLEQEIRKVVQEVQKLDQAEAALLDRLSERLTKMAEKSEEGLLKQWLQEDQEAFADWSAGLADLQSEIASMDASGNWMDPNEKGGPLADQILGQQDTDKERAEALKKAAEEARYLEDSIMAVTNAVLDLGLASDTAFGAMVNGMAQALQLWVEMGRAQTDAERWALAARGAQGAYAAGQQNSGIGGVFSGAAQGAAAGNRIVPGIGGVVGGFVGGALAIFGQDNAAEERARQAEAQRQAEMEAHAEWARTEGFDAFVKLADQVRQVQREMAVAGAQGLASLFDGFGEAADDSQERLDRLARMGIASFTALRQQGLSTREALEAFGPTIEAAIKAAADSGLELSGPMAELADFYAKLDSETGQSLLAQIDGLNAFVAAMRSVGDLTQETLPDVMDEFNRLQESAEDLGLTEQQTLQLLAPLLAQLKQAAEDGAIQLDEQTQALINLADEQHLFDDMVDPVEQLVELQAAMLELWSEIAGVMGVEIPAAVKAAIDKFRELNSTIPSGVPVPQPSGAPGTTTAPGGSAPPPPGAAPPGSPGNPTGGSAFGTPGVDYEHFSAFGEPHMMHGPEAVVTPAGARSLAGDIVAAMAEHGGGGGGLTVNVDARGSRDEAATRRAAKEGVIAGMRAIREDRGRGLTAVNRAIGV